MVKQTMQYSRINFGDDGVKLIARPSVTSFIDVRDDYPNVFHEEIEIKLFFEGNSTLIVGGETIVAKEGDIVVINPYEFHSVVDCGQDNGKYHLFMIGLDFFGNTKDALDLRHIFTGEKIALQTHICKNERIKKILTAILAEMSEKRDFYRQAVYGLVLELFSVLLRDYKSNKNIDVPSDKNIRYYEAVYPAIQKLRMDYAEKISIDELAKMCNVSKFHFCHVFKIVTGMSVLQYQTKYRLQVADIFLENTTKTVSEIAEMCGFEDICYFSRCYKKHTGISPKQKRTRLSK